MEWKPTVSPGQWYSDVFSITRNMCWKNISTYLHNPRSLININ